MIRFIRSAEVTRGKRGEAVHYAREIADYLNEYYPDAVLQVFTPRFGNLYQIFWTIDLADLASLEELDRYLAEDEAYQEIVAKGVALFVEGSVRDTVWVEN